MPNAPITQFNEVDQSFQVDSLIKGVAGVLVKTRRGKYGISDDLYTSWSQFKKHYGAEALGYDGVLLAKRALDRGAMLRVYKIGHFTTISNPATLDAVKGIVDDSGAIPDFAVDGTDEIFDLTLKYPGADYNNLRVFIENASNGDTDSFNLRINHILEPDLAELYENIKVVGKPALADCHFLDEVIQKSKFFDVVYKNILAYVAVAPFRPVNGSWSVTGGTDGGAIVDADYTGDSGAKNGFFGFDNYDDIECIAPLDNFATAVHTAGSAYAALRQDLFYIASLPTSLNTVATLTAARAASLVDSRFTYFVTGGVKIQNPYITTTGGAPYNISEVGDVIGIAMKSSAEFGPWWVFSETQRGQVLNALGVVNNFGPNYADLNSLALRQINCVINKGGRIYLTGNASGQLATSRKSFMNVVKLIIFLKKSLKPTVDRYLGQPGDFRTFREIFNEVTPFLESLKGNEKRALIDYSWQGDQFANTDEDLKINNRADLDLGKYKVLLYLKEAVGLNELTISIISSPSGVTFEDSLN